MKNNLLGIAVFWVMVSNGYAATLRVPQDYSWENAYSAAQSGDEIVLSPGVYPILGTLPISERITFRSTFDGTDWNIIRNTVIKGSIDHYDSNLFEVSSGGSGTIFRGLTMTFDQMTTIPKDIYIKHTAIQANAANVTVEYCIIENCIHVPGRGGPATTYGAAIRGVNGVIQNNIIRNNIASSGGALSDCEGIIRNNLIYNDNGYVLHVVLFGPSTFMNNTLYSSSTLGVNATSASTIANNIIWQSGSGNSYYSGPAPRNCVIKGYTGLGTDIITSNPKFVDAVTGIFQLQASSPCIDAGVSTDTIRADIIGTQRGIKGVLEVRGDGSCTDIGAYEYKPTPVAVWLPNGGPDRIRAGDSIKVAWQMQNPPAGTAITLKLYRGTSAVATLGAFWNANGADESIVTIPRTIAAPQDYTIRGISNLNQTLFSETPLMMVLGAFNALPGSIWTKYL